MFLGGIFVFGWLVGFGLFFFNDTFLDKLQNHRDRSECVSLGDNKIFESPESYVYAYVCIYSLLAFKHSILVGVLL